MAGGGWIHQAILSVNCNYRDRFCTIHRHQSRSEEVLKLEIYVDDILSGDHTISAAQNKNLQIQNALKSANMELRKWSSKDIALLDSIPSSNRCNQTSRSWGSSDTVKTLGMHWLPNQDCFTYKLQASIPTGSTKREILSSIARLFDPLGLIAPILISMLGRCSSVKNCYHCGQRHHSLLHPAVAPSITQASQPNSPTVSSSQQHIASIMNTDTSPVRPLANPNLQCYSSTASHATRQNILLATARIIVCHPQSGAQASITALIDQGSEATIISEHTVQALKLPLCRIRASIAGVGQTTGQRCNLRQDAASERR